MSIRSGHTGHISFKRTRVRLRATTRIKFDLRGFQQGVLKWQYGILQLPSSQYTFISRSHYCHLNITSADLCKSDREAGPHTGMRSHDLHLKVSYTSNKSHICSMWGEKQTSFCAPSGRHFSSQKNIRVGSCIQKNSVVNLCLWLQAVQELERCLKEVKSDTNVHYLRMVKVRYFV